MRKPSLYGETRECFICHSPYVELHHIYPSSRRPISDREGCTVYLCREHHQGLSGVHRDHELDLFFRTDCQRRWMRREGLEGDEGRDAFRATFHGMSYV